MKMISIKRITLALVALCAQAVAVWGAVPARYYADVNGKKDAELKTALSNIIIKRTNISSYSETYNNLKYTFQQTDLYPNSKRWWDMYSDEPLYAPSFSGLNREHAFPKSWWGGLKDIPAYVDLNHLYPSEMEANMKKSNYPLGEVSSALFNNGVVKVGYAVNGQGGGAAQVFEPADEYKGDFARTYFYMVTCYQNLSWNKSYMWMLQQNTYPTLTPWAVELLLKWHREDQVSQKELDRNEAVYKIQNNRNPFIDYPQLVEYIWGNKKGELFYEDNDDEPAGNPILITPVQDMALDFNEVAVGNTTTSRLYFKGENLKGRLELIVTGADKGMFALETKTIDASKVNSTAGYWLTVTYKPTATGEHSAKLIVSEGGITGSLGVLLKGKGCPVPTLKAFKALPAEDVTATSYKAVWEEPDDVVDYYIVTRTRYMQSGNSTVEDLLAETNSLVIDDFDPSISESYNVRSVRLGYESPRSNEIYVDNAGIDEVTGDLPIGTAYEPGGVRFLCGTPHTGGVIYDMQGRTVMTVDVIENNTVVMLPAGVYIITTDQSRKPLRMVVR